MKRNARKALAQETVEVLDRGRYTTAAGRAVSIAGPLAACLDRTRLFDPSDVARLRCEVLARPVPDAPAAIELHNETTLAGASRAVSESDVVPVAALNFASAKNPGGGFMNGSEAQEESLARSSGLYASQLRAPDFYARHRRMPSCLYSDAVIVSPACPVFRGDGGELLDEPYPVTFLTCPAPNAGAVARNSPDELAQLTDVFLQRAEGVLAVAAWHDVGTLVLGAWGCGVFRNDPRFVAGLFAELLSPGGPWRHRFRRVVFSVFDRTAGRETFAAFESALAGLMGRRPQD